MSQTNVQKPVVFTGHNAYMMSVARVCREADKFTDVNIICPDGNIKAHRLILAAASATLRTAFLQVPANDAEGLAEYSIIVPDVRKQVVASLIDFLYTVILTLVLICCNLLCTNVLTFLFVTGKAGFMQIQC